MAELQPLVHEVLLGGTWTDLTSLIERDDGNGVRILRRPLNWGERVAPTTASWTYKNPDGDLYGRNPNSAYYGLLGRNIQTRHRLLRAQTSYTSSVSSAWPTPEKGPSWTNSGGAASDYSSSSGFGRHTHTSVNVFRTSTIDLNSTDQDIQVDVKFDIGTALTASVGHWIIVRSTDLSNYYAARVLLTTTATVTLGLVKRVGGTLSGIDDGAITIATGHTGGELYTVRVSIRGEQIRAMAWPQNTTPPANWQHAVDANDENLNVSTGTKHTLASRLESGNTNTLNVVASWDNHRVDNYRFWGEIPSFSPQRDSTGRRKSVPVTAAGLGQRLGAGSRPLRSALTRTMDGLGADGDIVPVSHWPMEDPAGSQNLGNLRAGGPATMSGAVLPGSYSYSGQWGSQSVPLLNSGGQIAGVFPPTELEAHASTGGKIWQLQFQGVIPSGMSGSAVFLEISIPDVGGDSAVKLKLDWDNAASQLRLRPFDRSGAALSGTAISFVGTEYLYDRPVLYGINVIQAGGPGSVITLQLGAYTPGHPANVVGSGWGASLTTTVPVPQSWRALATAANSGWSFSHFAYYTSPAIFDLANQQDNANALDGHSGELAGYRLPRLCAEVGIPFTLIGDPDDTAPCGPQQAGSLLSALTSAADADQGALYEPRDLFGFEYVTLSHMLNRAAKVEFSHQGGHDLESFQVVDDLRTTRNKITARRSGGSFATAEITEGPTSTAESPDGIGEIPEDLAWNVASDDQLLAMAGWRAHLRGWDEARYPASAVWRERQPIASVPALDAAVLSLDLVDRYTITDPPDDLPPDDIALKVQAYDELLANFEHRITLDGTAARPYDVWETDDDDTRVDDDHFLRTAVNSSATSWEIANSEPGIQLIADDSQDGWFWMVNGERVQVTDVTAPTIAFVGVGTASTGSSGSRTPGLPASAATGNLILIWASTRNSGTGTVDDLSTWDTWYRDGNVALLAKIYDGSGAGFMPTVTYTGGAANEDTIAQSAAFSGRFHDVTKLRVRSTGRLNSSAQDIFVPGTAISRLPENLMAIYLGWKQDDFTSVATPGSWTELQEASTAAGNDASQVWGYRQFTTRPAVGALQPALAVTGGASAISRGAVVVFASDYQLVTVVRGINGISKSQAAGSIPQLVPGSHLAL